MQGFRVQIYILNSHLLARLCIFQHALDAASKVLFYVALPETQDNPAKFRERIIDFFITLHIAGEVLLPIGLIAPDLFARMLFMPTGMPEVPVNEDGDFLPRQRDIRRSWQSAEVLAIAQATVPQCFSKHYLRLGISPADAAHGKAPLLFREIFPHCLPPFLPPHILIKNTKRAIID